MRMHPMAGGWLEVVCGPMFSGKSEELMRRLRRAEIARQAVAVFKPAIDDRFDATDIVSHAGLRMRGVPVRHVGDVAELAEPLDVVGIDEAQFFGPEIVGVVQSLTRAGRRVVVAAPPQLWQTAWSLSTNSACDRSAGIGPNGTRRKSWSSPATMTRVPRSASSSTPGTIPSPRNCASSIPTTSKLEARSVSSATVAIGTARIRAPAWLTTSVAS